MSDDFKINNIFSRLKSRFVGQSYSSSSPGYAAAGKKKERKEEEPEKKEENYSNPANEKLFKLGGELGLSITEVIEAVELILKATVTMPDNTDTGNAIINNDGIKFPHCDNLESYITDRFLEEIKVKTPDLHLAITDPFEFMCRYPKTTSIERFKQFSYTEILEFSNKCPEEYEKLKEQNAIERENEST